MAPTQALAPDRSTALRYGLYALAAVLLAPFIVWLAPAAAVIYLVYRTARPAPAAQDGAQPAGQPTRAPPAASPTPRPSPAPAAPAKAAPPSNSSATPAPAAPAGGGGGGPSAMDEDPPAAPVQPSQIVPLGWERPTEHHGRGDRRDIATAQTAATAAAAAAAATAAATSAFITPEQPCTVKLRLWPFDKSRPRNPLENARLTIPHAVLCSEMGTHFSPCGRYLAACIACLPLDGDVPPAPAAADAEGRPVQQMVYELRVYSLEDERFGEVLAARAVRAAHCLTSIQFSPTSDHLLLAYGRRHISLLRSLVHGSGSIIPVHTILEVYRVSDMELVRVLPSAEDEVNVACFHPRPGGGLAYGTKEGKLRILRHDRTPSRAPTAHVPSNRLDCLEDELLEAEAGHHTGLTMTDSDTD
mmetsp:Transcript_1199/g.3966  ORF Transcript_1199/g.3966 Transcript_1199/m.3966 type:complete len:415 (+) Transcript_1199:126-1370(+)